jgi:hypothetical protein
MGIGNHRARVPQRDCAGSGPAMETAKSRRGPRIFLQIFLTLRVGNVRGLMRPSRASEITQLHSTFRRTRKISKSF